MISYEKNDFNLEMFAKGKRGKVYLIDGKLFGFEKGRRLIVKKFDREDRALNEADFLLKLNEKGIGPHLFLYGNYFIVMEYCDGVAIKDYIFGDEKIKIVCDILLQCFEMDKLRINKLEMHKPLKHIIIGSKVWMIDFERCYYCEKPKNVSQFCEYLVRLFGYSRDDMIKLVREYKKEYSYLAFMKVLDFVKS